MLSALTKMEHVDCIAVLVSVNGIFKFLGVPPSYSNIIQDAFENGLMNSFITRELKLTRNNLVKICIIDQLTQFQTLYFFLGQELPENNNFQKPGACHRAKWMAKIIYYIKIILFRSKFELNETGLLNLGHFTLFIMRLYLKVWYTSNDTSAMIFIQTSVKHYHFFDPRVDIIISNNIKAKMVTALDTIVADYTEQRIKLPVHRLLVTESGIALMTSLNDTLTVLLIKINNNIFYKSIFKFTELLPNQIEQI
ncbi:Uncharacterized protein FWK35_00024676, partial [Aphis craccivora]